MNRKYLNTNSKISCGYKSIKICDMELVKRFDRLCRVKNKNWGDMTEEAIKEYLANHENDDLKTMNRYELEELIKQYRSGEL